MRWVILILLLWASIVFAQDSVWIATAPNCYTTASVDTIAIQKKKYEPIVSLWVLTGEYDTSFVRDFERLTVDTVESIVYVFTTLPKLVVDTTITERRVDALGVTSDNMVFEYFYEAKELNDFDYETETWRERDVRIPRERLDRCTLWKHKSELPKKRLFNIKFDGDAFR